MSVQYSCPHCGHAFKTSEGFDERADFFYCPNCGQRTFNPSIYSGEKFVDVYWFCDGCNALLNKQIGFNDKHGIWFCSECGYKNIISLEHIRNS